MAETAASRAVVIDFKHVLSINKCASRLLHELLVKFNAQGKALLFTHTETVPNLVRYMKAKLKGQFATLFRSFEDNDSALE